jgi:hypothetical protein
MPHVVPVVLPGGPVGVIDDTLLREEYIAAYEAPHPARPVLQAPNNQDGNHDNHCGNQRLRPHRP